MRLLPLGIVRPACGLHAIVDSGMTLCVFIDEGLIGNCELSMTGLTGEMLRSARRACGLTQRDLARTSGISMACIRDFEQERVRHLRKGAARRLVTRLGLHACFSVSSEGLDTYLTDGLLISILGPLSVARNGTQLQIGGVKQQRLLALLALHRGVPVSQDSVVDLLWGNQPPRTAIGLVQTYVSRLRHILWPTGTKQISGSILTVDHGGYKLLLHAEQLDSVCFDYLIRIAQWCTQADFHAAAFGLYGKALSLWRGEPLDDVEPLHEHPSAVHLRRQWADAVSGYALAGLAEGWYADIIPSLYEFCSKDQANELARALLIRALAGYGLQAAALKEFDDIRTYLDDELGVLPGRALNEAHLAVLRQSIPPPRLRQPEVTRGTADAERSRS